MLVIRLRRIGKKNKPAYRIVVAEHTNPVSGKIVADLGFYNPHTKKIGLPSEPVKEWLDKGAQPSNTVAKLLTKEKIKHHLVVVATKNRPAKKKPESGPSKPSPAAVETEAKTEVTASEEAAGGSAVAESGEAAAASAKTEASTEPDSQAESTESATALLEQPIEDVERPEEPNKQPEEPNKQPEAS